MLGNARETFLLGMLDRRVSAENVTWLRQVASFSDEGGQNAWFDAFAASARRLGKAPLILAPEERAALHSLGATDAFDGWAVDDVGRAALLTLAANRRSASEFEALLDECYRRGETRERRAVLRALPLLPRPERFLGLAADACRTHVQALFEAIACENPYPAAYFPDLPFNQLVLKALFLGIALERIVGRDRRRTAELARMAQAYASERRAAGRSIPGDIGLLIAEESDVS